DKHFKKLPRIGNGALPNAGERLLIDCLNRVRLLDPSELSAGKDSLLNSQTAAVLSHAIESLPALSETIAVSYFAHSQISHTGW
ncbi:MAG: hypothetical protein RLZZ399_2379, partial [Verrucomicrobiota bacterium]